MADEPREAPAVRELGQAMDEWAQLANRIGLARARIAADWHEQGFSYADIARILGISRARAQQLVERGR